MVENRTGNNQIDRIETPNEVCDLIQHYFRGAGVGSVRYTALTDLNEQTRITDELEEKRDTVVNVPREADIRYRISVESELRVAEHRAAMIEDRISASSRVPFYESTFDEIEQMRYSLEFAFLKDTKEIDLSRNAAMRYFYDLESELKQLPPDPATF